MKLSDTKVRNCKPKDKDYKLSDGHGLYLLVKKNGSKYWRFKYRYLGKEKTLAMGVYPLVTLHEAREEHVKAQQLLKKEHKDPSTEKRIQKLSRIQQGESVFRVVAMEWIDTKDIWAESHRRRVISSFER